MSKLRIGLFSREGRFFASENLKLLQAFWRRHRTGVRTGLEFSMMDRGVSGGVEVSDSGTG
tara:strand:+ start:471 stop:653 length:183 start_codon:yes stop_codon:yes gene_type:complete